MFQFETDDRDNHQTPMTLFRAGIDRIEGYVPGEQPQESGWVKLNTNENPYPPSPRVIAAIKAAAEGRLNVYPDPLATRCRELAARTFSVDPDWILPANGSDENLTILIRTFVDAGELICYPYPSYILYETLAGIQGARHERLQLNADWSWDFDSTAAAIARSKMVLVPNPNSPSGTLWTDEELQRLVPPNGIFVLDQAYGDFRDQADTGAILRGEFGNRIVITRTLSKSYSLAGVRVGFAIAHPDLIAGMRKAKDSYNCNSLSLAAAVAALEDQNWMLDNVSKLRCTRTRLTNELIKHGFAVVPSQANFVWATHPTQRHADIFQSLKARQILVRYMKFQSTDGTETDGIRITIGTDDEIDRFLFELKQLV